jgi:hypothetical protein
MANTFPGKAIAPRQLRAGRTVGGPRFLSPVSSVLAFQLADPWSSSGFAALPGCWKA